MNPGSGAGGLEGMDGGSVGYGVWFGGEVGTCMLVILGLSGWVGGCLWGMVRMVVYCVTRCV